MKHRISPHWEITLPHPPTPFPVIPQPGESSSQPRQCHTHSSSLPSCLFTHSTNTYRQLLCVSHCASPGNTGMPYSLLVRPCWGEGGSCPYSFIPGVLHTRPSLQRTMAPPFLPSEPSPWCRSSGSENPSFHLHYRIFFIFLKQQQSQQPYLPRRL